MENTNQKLLSREDFRESVFKRDQNRCVVCLKSNVKLDAHHIIERRLWEDGGYYLNNGASVCEDCHLKCEKTDISPERLRELCGIIDIILPEHMYKDTTYDKWGNVIISEDKILPGELFYDESVQKIIEHKLSLFREEVKYPRTFHFPFSEGKTDDDRVMYNFEQFSGLDVVATLKLDGENTTIYPSGAIHARSLEYVSRSDRDRVKALAAKIGWEIPNGWRICGENVYAKHSIDYKNLEDFFYVFSIWEKDNCISWEETEQYANMLGIKTVPVLYRGSFDLKVLKSLHKDLYNGDEAEGFVVRPISSFKMKDFKKFVIKYVRKNHVRTNAHWTRQIYPNSFIKNI